MNMCIYVIIYHCLRAATLPLLLPFDIQMIRSQLYQSTFTELYYVMFTPKLLLYCF